MAMGFSELLTKVLGLDQTKQYDIVESSTVEQTEEQPPAEPPTEIPAEPPKEENQVITPEQLQEIMNQNAAKDATINQLKAMNLALLSKTPTEDTESLTLEDRIYMAVYGNKQKSEG